MDEIQRPTNQRRGSIAFNPSQPMRMAHLCVCASSAKWSGRFFVAPSRDFFFALSSSSSRSFFVSLLLPPTFYPLFFCSSSFACLSVRPKRYIYAFFSLSSTVCVRRSRPRRRRRWMERLRLCVFFDCFLFLDVFFFCVSLFFSCATSPLVKVARPGAAAAFFFSDWTVPFFFMLLCCGSCCCCCCRR